MARHRGRANKQGKRIIVGHRLRQVIAQAKVKAAQKVPIPGA